MRPYYEADGITLYHGDCRECRKWYGGHVLVTDPPYGKAWRRSANTLRATEAHDGIANDEDTSMRDWALAQWADEPAVVFGSLYAPAPKNVRHILIWEKPPDAGVIGSTTGFRRDVEAIYLLGKFPRRVADRGSVLRSAATNSGSPSSPAGRTGHPHAKPVDLICTLLSYCPPGVVVDPFAGSGSILVAAKIMGRRAIGVELEEKYCEVAAERLSQMVLDLGAA